MAKGLKGRNSRPKVESEGGLVEHFKLLKCGSG